MEFVDGPLAGVPEKVSERIGWLPFARQIVLGISSS
jgi:hypothetical protein